MRAYSKSSIVAVCVFLAAIIWIVFGQTLGHELVNFDDDEYVSGNSQVAGGLTVHGTAWAFTHVHSSNWHPVTWLSHMLDCQLYGLNPGGHHFTNLLLHTATAVALFLLLLKMMKLRPDAASEQSTFWCSAFVAAVFAIHPLRVESVAWVSERKDVLSGLFFVLTLLVYSKYAESKVQGLKSKDHSSTAEGEGNEALFECRSESEHPQVGCYKWYGLTLIFFALGLMSKPMLVTLPLVLLLLDYWPLGRFTIYDRRFTMWKLVVEKVPLLILCGVSCLATIFAQKNAMAPLPLSLRLGNAPVSYVTYLKQTFYPVGLAAYYPHPENSLVLWKIIGATVLLLSISAIAVSARRRQPWLLMGWLWFVGMLVPVIGILQVGSQAHADRYTYLPQIGLLVALTWTLAEMFCRQRQGPIVLGGLSTIIVAALMIAAHAQAACWRNSELLWAHTLACTSNNVVALNNLGSALLRKGDADGAIAREEKALAIKPDFADAHNNLGNALLQNGRVNEAIAHYQTALQITPHEAGTHFNLGNALLRKGRVDEAMGHYRKAIELRPEYAEAHNHLGNALLQAGHADDAILHYRAAMDINPRYAKAANNLGFALLQQGNVDEAIVLLEKVLKLDPNNPEAHFNLGNAFVQREDLSHAIQHYQIALQLNPRRADIHYRVAMGCLRQGNVSQAITELQETLRIEPDLSEAQNDLAWLLATSSEASLRNGDEAVVLARRANQLTGGGNVKILRTLAAANAEAGQFAEAKQSARKAVALAQATGRSDAVDELNNQLKLYEAGVPFHQSGN